ncbi:HNH endonuclease signature motif containing protein [Rhodococcoides kyotonense]|uniref:HNH endonuclease signature motif containing protein n=1 Tax=Rhodococcoides kyotonense TaxID=398843 RepID=UPI001C3E6F31|nr:HNH endonuclease signature motif containing protein [Rhodococcus kyotonensis]
MDPSVDGEDAANAAPLQDESATLSSVLPIEAGYPKHVVEVIEEHVEVLGRIQTVALPNSDRRALLTRMEMVSRALFGMSHTWIADLMDQHGLDDIYGSVPDALAVLMRFSRARAGQRVRFAEQFGERTAMSGERLEPVLAATAMAAEDGVLDEEHQNTVRLFFKRLGSKVDPETRESAERQLSQLAKELLPDEFKAAARRLYDSLDPDGDLPPDQVADRAYVRFGVQGEDGLSKVTGVVDAEFRSYAEAMFAKWAKPGMCNPSDEKPVVDEPDQDNDEPDQDNTDGDTNVSSSSTGQGGPTLFDRPDGTESDVRHPGDWDDHGSGSESGVRDTPDCGGEGSEPKSQAEVEAERRAARDHRGQGRRQHDAMKVVLRQMLASGKLGQHRGLPVTAIVSMNLKDLEAASGHAVTATGSLVKMRDAIRMASHAHHYLVIFDNDGRPLHLGRSKRLASADQRIVLMASDRGCTHPGCTRPAVWSQVHHIDEWAKGGGTNIDSLTLGCDQHHQLIGPSDSEWATTKAGPDHRYPGRTLWHTPAIVDPSRRGRVNHYHHPNEYIYPNPDVPRPDIPRPDIPRPDIPQPDVPPPDADGRARETPDSAA